MGSPDVFLALRVLVKRFLAKRVLTCWFMSMNGLLASFSLEY